MLAFIIFQFVFSISLAVFVSRKIFEYDISDIKRNKIILASIGLFFLIFAIIASEVTPKVKKYFFLKSIEESMLLNPMFVSIKKYDENLYQTLLDEASQSFDNNRVSQDMTNNIRAITGDFFNTMLTGADDDIIIEYFKLTMLKIKHLQSIANNTCFDLLFPETEISFNEELLTQDLITKEVEIFNILLKRAKQKNEILSEQGLYFLIGPLYIKFEESYSEELKMLDNPFAPNVNKSKICELMTNLYTEIIMLPEEDAGAILRTVLSLK
jgi:hypothetical protein